MDRKKLRYINKKQPISFNLGKSTIGQPVVNTGLSSGRGPTGAGKLASYRLYRIDGAGRISTAEWLDAADDRSASEQVAGLCLEGGTVELWSRDRLVARVEAPRAAASSVAHTQSRAAADGLPPSD